MRKFWQRPTRGVVCSYNLQDEGPICNLINTRLQLGVQQRQQASPFNGFPADNTCIRLCAPAEAGVNESAAWKPFRLAIILLALSLASAVFAAQTQDAEYEGVAEEYVKTYLAAHPLQGTALGFHEYDGKINDYSRLALDAELSRLRRFDDRLAKFDPAKLSPRQSIDLRILQAAVKRELFEMQDMSVFERNPMVYARAGDVNVYIKRNFAPLEDRVRSLVAIESQIPNILIAARTNLDEKLPKPFVELAIQIARGSADFLKKDLVAAVSGSKTSSSALHFRQPTAKPQTRSVITQRGWNERNFPKPHLISLLAKKNSAASWRRRSWSIFRHKKFSRSAWRN